MTTSTPRWTHEDYVAAYKKRGGPFLMKQEEMRAIATNVIDAQALDEAVLRTLGAPFCKLVFGNAFPHNHLPILATMPNTLWSIRREYDRITAGAKQPWRLVGIDLHDNEVRSFT